MKAKVAVLSLVAGLLLTSVSLSLAETMVGGHITTDTVWDKAGSPYTLTEDLIIDEGVTLTIEPGVTVYGNNSMYSRYGITVDGALIAKGTETEWIKFTKNPNSLSEWTGMAFTDSSDDQKCILEYCEVTGSQVIVCRSASPTISWCKIDGSGGGSGIEVLGGPDTKPLITHTQIDDWGVGIVIVESSPIIEYCLLGIGNSGSITLIGPEGNPRVRFNDLYANAGAKWAILDIRQNFWSPEALEEMQWHEERHGKTVDYSDRLLTPGWGIDWTTGKATWVEVESESWGEVKSKF